LEDALSQQQFAVTREAVHRETAETTGSRVLWWTVAQAKSTLETSGEDVKPHSKRVKKNQALVLTTLSLVQVYYLKSYFRVKQII
jgi:hypothetical protein